MWFEEVNPEHADLHHWLPLRNQSHVSIQMNSGYITSWVMVGDYLSVSLECQILYTESSTAFSLIISYSFWWETTRCRRTSKRQGLSVFFLCGRLMIKTEMVESALSNKEIHLCSSSTALKVKPMIFKWILHMGWLYLNETFILCLATVSSLYGLTVF